MTQKSAVLFPEFGMGYHMYIRNCEAPAIGRILEIAAINEVYVPNLFRCPAVSVI